jgi:hypothetical protein
MKKFKEFLIEDPIITSVGGLQPSNPYGPTNASLTLQNMNDYLYNPIFNPTSQPPLASTWPYPNIATGAGSALYDSRGYKRSLNRPIPMPKAPPRGEFNPDDPFWQTDIGRWILTQLANMIRHWNDQEWWSQNSTYSFENRYSALQDFIRQASTMIVEVDSSGNLIYAPPLPDIQGDSSWINSFDWTNWLDNWNDVGTNPNTNQSSNAFRT